MRPVTGIANPDKPERTRLKAKAYQKPSHTAVRIGPGKLKFKQ